MPVLLLSLSVLTSRTRSYVMRNPYTNSADSLWCEEIDCGEDEPRQIASGLKAHYSREQMTGKRLLVVCNLKAKNLRGFKSHGMVMCAAKASDGDKERVEFIDPPADAPLGERVTYEGLSGEPITAAQVEKKKVFPAAQANLRTAANADSNGNFVAQWNGISMMTSAGPCVAPTLADAVIR